MNPFNFDSVIKYLGEVNKAVYGINPYDQKEEADDYKDEERANGDGSEESINTHND